ncbi:ATP-binding protein [Novispirillum sp. DQ9]|uniref:PAS domain-containing sensor histidine kinase n=1 Tax=Novispirillum sp. DQ9 TaxID=3398612 RepID=UPI003C7B2E5E
MTSSPRDQSASSSLPDGGLLAAATRHMQAGVAVTDRQGLYVDINQHYCDLRGYSRDELLGKHFTEVTPPQFREPLRRLHDTFFATGREAPSYWQLRRKDGKEIYVKTHSTLYQGEGGDAYRVTTMVDMTDRYRLERELAREKECAEAAISRLHAQQKSKLQAEKMASLDDLLCGVAHELNTPIGVTLTGATHLLRKVDDLKHALADGSLTQGDLMRFLRTAEDTLTLLRGSTERASAVVESFRQVAAGRDHEDPVAIALRPHAEAVVHSLAHVLARQPVDLRVEIAPDLQVVTYPGVLGRCMAALLTNALEHGLADRPPERGPGRLLLWAGRAGDTVTITVRDNGQGIATKDLPRVFDPFFSGARSLGRTGLGLHMTYNLVTQTLGGAISVESVRGHHTAFRVTIPLDVRTAGTAGATRH